MTVDLKDTVFLPQTSFSMKASLKDKEPLLLETWQDVYDARMAASKTDPVFLLHDGPPYANGHLHMGHALNKILKDVVIKYKYMCGHQTPYVPGWDCHGLPIEWMVETAYREQGKNKDDIPPLEFRKECRAFAAKWVEVQTEEFKRLGVIADFKNPYLTMDKASEALIVQELHKFLMNGSLYKGEKPVYWSVVEKTALAEAEIEYKDKTSPSIYVAFPIHESPSSRLKGAKAVIWTTTPWTLPGNRAIAYHQDHTYALVKSNDDLFLVASELVTSFEKATGLSVQLLDTIKGKDLAGTICHHPLHDKGYDFEVPLFHGDHVTLEQGTGLVHTAPGHGVEDFEVGRLHGIPVPQTLDNDGTFLPHVPLFHGLHVYKANEPVVQALKDAGCLLALQTITHSYPHSWRSKAPLIFRTTPQWFVSMDKTGLRKKALEAIDQVKWVPSQGRNRLRSMVENRPDWCLSRQRAWGVPIAIFVHKQTGEPLRDAAVNARIIDAMHAHGSDIWFEPNAKERFLTPDHDPNQYDQTMDILDVWFESGCSYAFVIEAEHGLQTKIDLYLEGTDQHRGWFQSTLLASVGTRGVAPYKSVLTHGFIVDEKGFKLSKSSRNAVNLDDLIQKQGADVLRLWVVGSDYTEDLKIGPDILKHQEDIYRRLRNTLRYLLGNLPSDTHQVEAVPHKDLPLLEQWVLHRLYQVQEVSLKSLDAYDIHGLFRDIYTFCTSDLSSFYFDIRKDTLYCDARHSKRYKGAIYTLKIIFDTLTKLLAPVVSFTADEAWQTVYPGKSIHVERFESLPSFFLNYDLDEAFGRMRMIRQQVMSALEKDRAQKKIGSSLQAAVHLKLKDKTLYDFLQQLEMEDILIVSSLQLEHDLDAGEDVIMKTHLASGQKCERCWRVLDEVTPQKSLCKRCNHAVQSLS